MKSWIQARGYPSDLVQKQMGKGKFQVTGIKKTKKTSEGVPLVIFFILYFKI